MLLYKTKRLQELIRKAYAARRKALTIQAGGTALIAAMMLGASSVVTVADQQGSVSGTATSQVGREVIPKAQAGVAAPEVRTVEQMKAFDAAHPALRTAEATHITRIPMGDAAYLAAKHAAELAPSAAKPATNTSAPPPAAPTAVVLNKHGPSESDAGNGWYPPDSNGAIGGNQLVAPVNLTFNVYNRSGTALLNVSFNGLLGTTNQLSDPRVIYDPIWHRWVISIIDVPASSSSPPACFWVAASTTASATGSWIVYHPCVSGGIFANGDLWDYDMMGMTQDAVLLTGNIFPWTGSYKGAAVIALPKAMIYNGLGFYSPVFTLSPSIGTLTPPIVQDSNANAYFVAADGTYLDLYRGTNLSNQSQFSFVLQAQIPASYSIPPNARQVGTTYRLDTLDGRFQAPSAQYSNRLWNVHTEALGTFPSPKFFQVDTGASSIVQSGFFYESSTSDDFNPSISANTSDEVFVNWSATDALSTTGGKHNARVRYSGRQSGDTLGVIGSGKFLVTSPTALTGNLQNGIQRWGDYSSVFLDSTPQTACGGVANRRAAIFNERIVSSSVWGIQFGIIGYC